MRMRIPMDVKYEFDRSEKNPTKIFAFIAYTGIDPDKLDETVHVHIADLGFNYNSHLVVHEVFGSIGVDRLIEVLEAFKEWAKEQ
jgi:hypothetical protein